MKTRVLILTVILVATGLHAQGTAFTYQGRLNSSGNNPANGNYDLRFAIWNAESGPSQVSGTVGTNALVVSNGLFTVTLDFGTDIFTGTDRWLEISVRTNGSGSFTTLSRQKLAATPYAVTAGNLVSGGLLAGTYGKAFTFSNSANSFSGSFSGNGAGVSNVNALTLGGIGSNGFWRTTGNVGTTPGVNFLGTADNQPLAIRVNGATALRIEPTATAPNIIGGLNSFLPTVVGANVRGAVVAGGNAPAGPVSGFGGGDFHAVYDSDGVIGGGFGNKVGTDNGDPDDTPFTTVAGGVFNSAAGYAATVAGGDGNFAGGTRSTVGGGAGNQATGTDSAISGGTGNRAESHHSSIGGGQNNVANNAHTAVAGGGWNTASGISSFIGGGGGDTFGGPWPNTASGNWSAILGGWNNTASGYSAVIGGGGNNTASGQYAVVPGGDGNRATATDSFAAGRSASAEHAGSFVWSDGTAGTFSSAGPNTFNVRAAGGVSISHDLRMNTGRTISSSGRLHIQANEDLYLNPFAGAATVYVGGGGGPGNLNVLGSLTANGMGMPNNFGPDPAFSAPGQYIAFGHTGVSEDFIGYRDNTFFFKDSPGGGDTCDPTVEVAVLRITGGCDLAEPFKMSHTDIPQGAVVIIDEDRPGQLKMSEGAYDTRVAGIVSGANGVKAGITLHQEGLIEGGQNVALTGRVYVQADATECAIKPGDLLTTSNTPGHAMKVTDHAKSQGAILGKAMTGLKEGKGMVLVLVTLQ